MTSFPIHSIESAPSGSQAPLKALEQAFGFVPNIAGAMAESPELLAGFIQLFTNVHEGTFSEAEIQVLLLTNAVTNRCAWAVAFHTALALKHGVAPSEVDAIRAGRATDSGRHGALSRFARALIERRGALGHDDLAPFLAAGYTRSQALEVVEVSAASTITNYVGNLAKPELEEAFAAHRWG
jgi:AhpD family alkylhydroperoxidase